MFTGRLQRLVPLGQLVASIFDDACVAVPPESGHRSCRRRRRPGRADQQPREHRPLVPPHELAQPIRRRRRTGLHRLVGQVALVRPSRSRWRSRSGGCGPSPAPSSRSNPVRRAPASSASPARCPGWRPTSASPRPCSASCSVSLAPARGSPAAFPACRPCQAPCGKTAGCRSSSSYKSTPSE